LLKVTAGVVVEDMRAAVTAAADIRVVVGM
jgi:hypothetical protein